MANQKAEGLFHRAIMESGGGLFTSWLKDLPVSRTRGEFLTTELTTKIGQRFPACQTNPQGDDCLKDLLFKSTAQDLKTTNLFNRIDANGAFEIHPYHDGTYVVGGTLDVFKCGRQKNLPMIIGSMGWEANIVESALNSNPSDYFTREGFTTHYVTNTIRPAYNNLSGGLLAERFYGDKTFGAPSRILAKLHAEKYPGSAYLYFFNYIGDGMPYTKGATHQLLTPFVFRSLETTDIGKAFDIRVSNGVVTQAYAPSPMDRAVASIWSGFWQEFIKNGPSSQGVLQSTNHTFQAKTWYPYVPGTGSGQDSRLMISHHGEVVSPSGQREYGDYSTYNHSHLFAARYSLIDSIYYPSGNFSSCPL